MKKFTVKIFETSAYEFEIEAEDSDQAIHLATIAYVQEDTSCLVDIESAMDESVPYVKEIS